MSIRVSLGTESKTFNSADEAIKYGDELHEKNGGMPKFETVTSDVSEFGGKLVTDEAAKGRIEGLHAKLEAGGINVNTKEQLYATGTRMAQMGYDTQAARKAEHDSKESVEAAAQALRGIVMLEKREDLIVNAGELASKIDVNGFAMAFGLKLSEQAIRGLTGRLNSPSLSYILGLRDRIRTEVLKGEAGNKKAILADKGEIAATIKHECERFPETKIKLRTRTGARQDIYAIVSPTYTPADAPAVLATLVEGLPKNARASYAYDPSTTSWELRAEVWTPTPVNEQAVGEPFEGYVSFSSKDDGTSRFRGGGGVNLIRCLNASTYVANGAEVGRVHRGRILLDIETMLAGSLSAINILCDAWGRARADEVQVPTGITIQDAIPGFYRHLLTDRRSELAGILRGRTEERVKGLSEAFFGERRVTGSLVRSDFAQGWTKYIQNEESGTRRDAEIAVGDWLVGDRKPVYVAAE
jgi:hypothetical protein